MARLALLLALAMLAGPAPAARVLPAPQHPTAEATRAEFAAVCHQLQTSDDPFFGEAILGDLRRRLARPIRSHEVRMGVRARLGYELLRLGQPEAAVARLTEALELAAEGGVPAAARRGAMRYLALAHLQLAEDLNCVERHNHASCILPVAPEAVHELPAEARRAGDLFAAILRETPDDLQARWLLNLARMISGDYPEGVPPPLRLPAGALASTQPFPRWLDVAPALGVNALDLSGGAVMEDLDGDGFLEVVSSTIDPCDSLKAFRNDGRGGFEEVTAAWGLDAQMGGLNLVSGDYDGDGRVDLLVLRGAWQGRWGRVRNSLLRNELGTPGGRFVDVTAAAGLAAPAYPTQTAAWADYDGDGDLDLYVGNEADRDHPYPSQLFRNDGDGTFTDVARQAGVENLRFAKGVAWGDYDDDGDPDLYVSNFGPNRLYRNAGDGTFTDLAPALGVTAPEKGFPTWFFDFDNDGDLDLLAADYGAPARAVSASYLGEAGTGGRPLLYRNEGGRFREVSAEVGLVRPLLPMGSNYGDLDNDGWPDIYFGTGIPDLEALMPNVMYRNAGGRFIDVTFAGGFGNLQKGHGVAFGDLDNDGDQDLFQQLGGAYPADAFFNALLENPGSENAWITLRLEGRRANRFGVGARIAVRVRDRRGSGRTIHALVGTGGSFGASSLQQEIGLGDAVTIDRIIIRWPGSGTVQTFRHPTPGRIYRAVEGVDRLLPVDLPRLRLAAPRLSTMMLETPGRE